MKMKVKTKKRSLLSDKIADALTVKPRADIEDDVVFGTKPKTLSKADFSSSDSEEDQVISNFRKSNVNLLSEVSKKYEGEVVTKKKLDIGSQESNELSDSDSENESINGQRQDLLASDSKDEDESFEAEESDDYSITQIRSTAKSSKKVTQHSNSDKNDASEDSDSSEGSGLNEESSGTEDEGEGVDISQFKEPLKENFEHLKKQNVSEEVKKGACVKNQLLLWEGLLEMRIHLQRCVTTANQMPMPDTYKEIKETAREEFGGACNVAKNSISCVLDKLLNLQNTLLKSFPETKNIGQQVPEVKHTKKLEPKLPDSDEEIPSDDDEEIPSDTEPEESEGDEKNYKNNIHNEPPLKKRKLEDYEKEISTTHNALKSFRNTTIEKWNEKTRLATATSIKNKTTNSILSQIDFLLSDRNKLIRRTQLKRSEYDIIGYKKETVSETNADDSDAKINPLSRARKENDEYITEIFDDSDFYHQLLRELIECKSADISDPVQLSRQWIALQQMRSKMKRKVDTKATKGRRIRYVVHNKLINFMGPEKSHSWTDESRNELYSSLFGKMFEGNVDVQNGNHTGFKITSK